MMIFIENNINMTANLKQHI